MTQDVYSMTGFGKCEVSNDLLQVTAEIKTVNHRFKDIRFKMSALFNSVELDMRNLIGENFRRGSFEVSISYKKSETKSRFDDIDQEKVKHFISSMESLASEANSKLSINPTDFLRSEFYKDMDESINDTYSELGMKALVGAIKELKESRRDEGQKLVTVLKDHRLSYIEQFQIVESKATEFQDSIKDRLVAKFDEYKTSMPVDEPRFMQEVLFYLEKMDIHEEINRIHAHMNKLDSILSEGGEVGRQIDFLIQELNRETNTTGSKSTLKEISECVVQMKVQLEKIREQGLNLE